MTEGLSARRFYNPSVKTFGFATSPYTEEARESVELDAEGLFSDPNKVQTKQGSWDAETLFSRTIGVHWYVEFGKKR